MLNIPRPAWRPDGNVVRAAQYMPGINLLGPEGRYAGNTAKKANAARYQRHAPRVLQTPTGQLLGFAGVLISVCPSLAFSDEQATAYALDSASPRANTPAVSFPIRFSLLLPTLASSL